MLQSLHIRHFALIEELHINFGDGLTIFTGETGAGKSILLDAMGMLAGKRASASFVRQGTESFVVEGAFFFSNENEVLQQVLAANHIEAEDGQLVISRQFRRNGRGTTLINGTLVPLTAVKQIGEQLLDIHGQYDNRLIFDAAYHVEILDSLTPALTEARRAYDLAYKTWARIVKEIKTLQKEESEKARLLSVLEFQIKEIEAAQLREGEDDELENHIKTAAHSEHIKNNIQDMLFAFEGGERQKGLLEQLETVQRVLLKTASYDPSFQETATRLEALIYEVADVHDSLVSYAEAFDFDERALDRMQSRLAVIEKLKRKYGFSIPHILAFLARSQKEYERLEESESVLAALQKKEREAAQTAKEKAAGLQVLRLQAAKDFQQQMTATLKELGMARSRIAFHIEPMREITPLGAATVALYFSANAGEAMMPLVKIASGGEISRIALALKSVSGCTQAEKTMIFDEIDVGISGQTGVQVAKHIRKLCQDGQIFCITHLPQTAAAADKHYFIYKQEIEGRTVSQVKALTAEEHVQEIARMFGGDDIREAGLTAARGLIAKSKQSDCETVGGS